MQMGVVETRKVDGASVSKKQSLLIDFQFFHHVFLQLDRTKGGCVEVTNIMIQFGHAVYMWNPHIADGNNLLERVENV